MNDQNLEVEVEQNKTSKNQLKVPLIIVSLVAVVAIIISVILAQSKSANDISGTWTITYSANAEGDAVPTSLLTLSDSGGQVTGQLIDGNTVSNGTNLVPMQGTYDSQSGQFVISAPIGYETLTGTLQNGELTGTNSRYNEQFVGKKQ